MAEPGLTLAEAQAALAAAVAKAKEIGQPMSIVVVDDGGNMKAFARMDGNSFGSVEVVIRKATTAAAFRVPSLTMGQRVQSEPGRFASFANLPKIWLGGGGVPIKRGDVFLGGIGAGGGTPEQDVEVAEAGVAAIV